MAPLEPSCVLIVLEEFIIRSSSDVFSPLCTVSNIFIIRL